MNRLRVGWQKQKAGYKLAVLGSGIYLGVVLLLVMLAPWLPLGFGPNQLDLYNPYLEPDLLGEAAVAKHWLGTDALGRDVLANLIFGIRTGVFIAMPVMVFSTVIGTILGSVAGFYGNSRLRISWAGLICGCAGFFLIFFYGFFLQRFSWQMAIQAGSFWPAFFKSLGWAAAAWVLTWLIYRLLKRGKRWQKKVTVPLDELILKATELLTTLPRLVLILCLAAVLTPGAGSLMLLLCLTYWVGPARLARSETLRLKNLPFIEAAQVSGLPDRRILFLHILVNAAGPLVTAFCFGLGSLLGLESALSFIGIGLPPETPSWGRLLAGVRLNPDAWWLLVFPGLSLWLTILAIQTAGNFLKKCVTNNGV